MINRDELLEIALGQGFYRNGFSKACVKHSNGSWVCVEDRLIDFANAILERAAVECDHAELHNDSDQLKNSDPRKTCGNAIRALKTK